MAINYTRKIDGRPSVELLREFISYDPASGGLVWKHRSVEHFRHSTLSPSVAAVIWNTQNAGRPALSCLAAAGCLKGKVQSHPMSAHIVAFAIYHGRYPAKPLRHINGDKSDNRLSNLVERFPSPEARATIRRAAKLRHAGEAVSGGVSA